MVLPNLDTYRSKMGMNSLPSESSSDLDEQITHLRECKPLSEQQVHLYVYLKKKKKKKESMIFLDAEKIMIRN